jgi:hypothetical protein
MASSPSLELMERESSSNRAALAKMILASEFDVCGPAFDFVFFIF